MIITQNWTISTNFYTNLQTVKHSLSVTLSRREDGHNLIEYDFSSLSNSFPNNLMTLVIFLPFNGWLKWHFLGSHLCSALLFLQPLGLCLSPHPWSLFSKQRSHRSAGSKQHPCGKEPLAASCIWCPASATEFIGTREESRRMIQFPSHLAMVPIFLTLYMLNSVINFKIRLWGGSRDPLLWQYESVMNKYYRL